MPSIADIPPEITSKNILPLLSPTDMVRLSQVNKRFFVESRDESIWGYFLKKNYRGINNYRTFINKPGCRKSKYLLIDAKGLDYAYSNYLPVIGKELHVFFGREEYEKLKAIMHKLHPFIVKGEIKFDSLIYYAKKFDIESLNEIATIYIRGNSVFVQNNINLETLINLSQGEGVRLIADYMRSIHVSSKLIAGKLLAIKFIYSLLQQDITHSIIIKLISKIYNKVLSENIKIEHLLKQILPELAGEICFLLADFFQGKEDAGEKILEFAIQHSSVTALLYKIYIRVGLYSLINEGFVTNKQLSRIDSYIGNYSLLSFIKLINKALPLFIKNIVTLDEVISVVDLTTFNTFINYIAILLSYQNIFERDPNASKLLKSCILNCKPEDANGLYDLFKKFNNLLENNNQNVSILLADFDDVGLTAADERFKGWIDAEKSLGEFGLDHSLFLKCLAFNLSLFSRRNFITALKGAKAIWQRGILDLRKYILKVIHSSKISILGLSNATAMFEATENLPNIIPLIDTNRIPVEALRKVIYKRSAFRCQHFIEALIKCCHIIQNGHLDFKVLLNCHSVCNIDKVAKMYINAHLLLYNGVLTGNIITQVYKKYDYNKTSQLIDHIVAAYMVLQKVVPRSENLRVMIEYISDNLVKKNIKDLNDLFSAITEAGLLLVNNKVRLVELLQYAKMTSSSSLLDAVKSLTNQHKLRQFVLSSAKSLNDLSRFIPSELSDIYFMARKNHPEYFSKELTFSEMTSQLTKKETTKWNFFYAKKKVSNENIELHNALPSLCLAKNKK